MIIVWGFKRYVSTLAMLTLVCGGCHQPTAHPLRKLITKFTLFWVPLFPTSTKYTLQCTFCGYAEQVPKEEAERLLASQPPQPAPASGRSAAGLSASGSSTYEPPVREQIPRPGQPPYEP